jgi:hypothetical protein
MTTVRRTGVKLPDTLREQFKPAKVKAGVLAGATYPQDTYTNHKTGQQEVDKRAGMPVAAIAQALEFGHGQNHPRPFMQSTFANNNRGWARGLVQMLKAGAAADTALRTIGVRMAEDIQQTIRDWPADNSEDWAAVKGFSHGLIFTGHLTNSIDSAVVQADGKIGEEST